MKIVGLELGVFGAFEVVLEYVPHEDVASVLTREEHRSAKSEARDGRPVADKDVLAVATLDLESTECAIGTGSEEMKERYSHGGDVARVTLVATERLAALDAPAYYFFVVGSKHKGAVAAERNRYDRRFAFEHSHAGATRRKPATNGAVHRSSGDDVARSTGLHAGDGARMPGPARSKSGGVARLPNANNTISMADEDLYTIAEEAVGGDRTRAVRVLGRACELHRASVAVLLSKLKIPRAETTVSRARVEVLARLLHFLDDVCMTDETSDGHWTC